MNILVERLSGRPGEAPDWLPGLELALLEGACAGPAGEADFRPGPAGRGKGRGREAVRCLEDYLLVRRCLAGCEGAWEEFEGRFLPLLRYVCGRFGCMWAFEDLYGDFRLWLWDGGLEGYDGGRPLSGVLSRRFADMISRLVKAERRNPLVPLYDNAVYDVVQQAGEREEVYTALHAAEEKLAPGELRILESYYLDGLSLKRLARLNKVAPSTILRRLRRSVKRLRAELLRPEKP